MAFKYPTKPWKDGQEIKETIGGREVVIAKYDASKNLWTHLRVNDEGVYSYVYACDVIVDFERCPCPDLQEVNWLDIRNVQHALEWLHYHLMNLFEKVEALEERVEQNEIDIKALYQLIGAIDGLEDLVSILERLDALEAQLPVYADEVRQGSRPGGLNIDLPFPPVRPNSIPDGVTVGSQQETNWFLWDHRDRKPIIQAEPPARHPGWPDDPLKEGDLWINSVNELYYWNGDNWILVEDEDNAPVYVGELPPVRPEGNKEGDLWWDSSEDEGVLYVWYENPDGEDYWVPASPPVSLDGINATIADALVVQSDLVSRVSAGETVQEQIQETISEALETQSDIKDSIIELEEEIESLAPSLDRGKWNLAELGKDVTLASGEYAMGIGVDSVYCQEQYLECVANANNDPIALSQCTTLAGECESAKDNGEEFFMNDWAHANFLHFHKTDSDGKDHSFSDYKVGMFIDLFDQGDSGFAVFEITAAPTLDGDVYTIGVTPIQHEGEASGLVRIKVFELSSSDPTVYVRKTGDEMSGKLLIKPPKDNAGLWIYAKQESGADADTQLVRVSNSNNSYVFYVKESGEVAGKQGYTPSEPRHLTPKSYVDKAVKQYASAAWVPQGRKFRYMESGQLRYIKAGEWGFQDPDWKMAYCSYRDAFGNSCVYSNASSLTTTGFLKIANPSGQVRAIGKYTKVETGDKSERDESRVKYTLSSWYRMNEAEFTPLSEWWLYDGLWLS